MVLAHLEEYHGVHDLYDIDEEIPKQLLRKLIEKPVTDVLYFDLYENGTVKIAREINTAANMKPSWSILTIILDGIHNLNISAGNALLKVLEDTPENVHVLCLTSSPHTIIPTIRSRLQYEEHDAYTHEITEDVRNLTYEWSHRNPEPLYGYMCGKIDRNTCKEILTGIYVESLKSGFFAPALRPLISQNYERMNTSNASVKYMIDEICFAKNSW